MITNIQCPRCRANLGVFHSGAGGACAYCEACEIHFVQYPHSGTVHEEIECPFEEDNDA